MNQIHVLFFFYCRVTFLGEATLFFPHASMNQRQLSVTLFSMRERKLDETIRDYHRLGDGDFFFRYAETRFLFVVAVQFTPSRDQTRQERVLERPLGRARKCCSSRAGSATRFILVPSASECIKGGSEMTVRSCIF